MGVEVDEIAERLSEAGAWQYDRRQFLKLAGASGLAASVGISALGAPVLSSTAQPVVDATPSGAPPDLTSVAELARSLEYDANRIFRFVSDQILYEPYAGVLRGAQATLDGRAGNSADQAVLLAALLDASLIPYRFVAGPLLAGSAEALLGSALLDPAAALADAQAISRGTSVRPPASRSDLPPEVLPILDRVPALLQAVRESAQAQFEGGIRTITDALTANSISLPTGLSQLPALERDSHMWVQMAAGATWVDLDPNTPLAAAGQTLATPTGAPFVVLPDGLRHRVELTLTAETIQGTGLAQAVILDQVEFADALSGVPITVTHEKPESLKAIGASISGTLSGTLQYLPVLAVGDHTSVGLTGLTFGSGGGILSVFGGTTGRDGEATAEWLDIRLVSPDGSTRTSRRTIFDRVGDASRQAGHVDVASIPPVQLVDLGPDVRQEFPPVRTLHSLAVATGSTSGNLLSRFATAEDAFEPTQLAGYLYHIGRDELAADLGVGHGVRTFLNGPNIASFSVRLEASSLESTSASVAFDLLHRSYGSLAVAGVQPTASPALIAGVLSHVAERIGLGDALPADIATDGKRLSVGAIFEIAASQGISTRVMRGSVAAGLPYSNEVLARLAARISDGWVVVLPDRPVSLGGADRMGWWLVRPETGETVDEMDGGGGTSIVEWTLNVLKTLWRTVKPVICLGLTLKNLFTLYELVFAEFHYAAVGIIGYFVFFPLHHAACH